MSKKNHQCSSLKHWLKRNLYKNNHQVYQYDWVLKKKESQPNLKENKQNTQPHIPKLLALPLLSSCSVLEDFAAKNLYVFNPVTQELCQHWSSSAQLYPTSSVKTPSEPCSYCKLLILWFLQRFSCRSRNTGPGLLSQHLLLPRSQNSDWN